MKIVAGKRVLVTGGTRGIGRATALALARAGARVVVCYRSDKTAAEEVAAELRLIGPGHRVVRSDVTDEQRTARLIGVCRDTLVGLDVLVNNVGVDGAAPVDRLSACEWRRVIDTDLTAAYLVTRAALPLLSPARP